MAGKVYITGATGRLGSAVLAKTGAIPLVRKQSGLPNEIVTDFSPEELRRILADASCVIHLAGSVDTLDSAKLKEANVELSRKITESARPACKIVFASSVSVYGKTLAEIPANEDTETSPDSAYSQSKYDAERLVSARPNHVILRIGTIYGPGYGDYYRVLGMIEKGRMRIMGDGNNRIPFVHVDDAADVVVRAVTSGRGTYVIAGEPLTQKEIYTIAADALGVQPPARKIRRAIALAMASFGEWKYKLGGRKPLLTREHIGVLAYDRVFDCSKAKKELGFSPRQLGEGIKAMARDYKGKR